MTSNTSLGSRVGTMRNTQHYLMVFIRFADIGQSLFRQYAVRQDDKIVRACKKVGRAPIACDHPAFATIAEHNPVADDVRSTKGQGDARKHIAQRVLQSETQNDGKYARCRKKRADRKRRTRKP